MQINYNQVASFQQGFQPIGQYAPPINTGLFALGQLPGIFIKQKLDLIEIAGCCEKKNAYFVYPCNSQEEPAPLDSTIPLFKCKEKSSLFQRLCLPAACRSFQMKVKQFDALGSKGGKHDDDQHLVLKFSRPFKCTFLCCARPIMEVYENTVEGGSNLLGLIYYPFQCCQLGVVIQDVAGNLIYKIVGSVCQTGVLCEGFPCKSCQTVYFQILDPNDQPIAQLTKESAGCLQACFTDANNFRVMFPIQATQTHRALLLAACLFLDYNYFERSPADQQNSSN